MLRTNILSLFSDMLFSTIQIMEQGDRSMKVFVYNMRKFDELDLFNRFTEELGMELSYTEEPPTIDNCHLADGYDCISIITTPITSGMIDRFIQGGVRMIATRTIGYDHIDIPYARERGMIVTHVTYDPEGVAEYTVMLMLAAIRKMKMIGENNRRDDFTLQGLMGRKLSDMTIGVIGAGRIGIAVLRDLSGFGCRLVYCNRSPSPEADRYAERMDLDELLRVSDMVSPHLELNDDTRHILDEEALSKMKEGSFIVNTARGPLIDSDALMRNLENGHLSGAALDVVEGEFGLYYKDCSGMDLSGTVMDRLRRMDNVLLTHHMAFYYDTAVSDMVYNCLYGMRCMEDGKDIPLRLV